MIEWVSDKDLFKELVEVEYDQIETPLVINDVLITNYKYTKLNNLILHQINVSGKEQNINNFKSLLDDIYHPLTFTFTNLTEVESFWLSRFIQLILYKDYHFNVTNVTYVDGVYTPYQNQNFLYVNHIISIDLNNIKGYIPLIDLCKDKVDIVVATSDLIYTLDLSLFKYNVVYGIPAI